MREEVILRRLKADAHDVAGRHVATVSVSIRLRDGKIAVLGFADQAVLPDVFAIGVQEEMDITTGVGEPRAVVSAQRSCSNDGVGACHSSKQQRPRVHSRK